MTALNSILRGALLEVHFDGRRSDAPSAGKLI